MAAEPHWHVLGAGAIGCLFAAGLARGGSDVTLLLRDSGGSGQVIIEDARGNSELTLPVVQTGHCAAISHLLVTTKAYDVGAALAACAGDITDGADVLLLVNGMGLAGPLQKQYPQLRFFLGTTTEGAHRLGPRHVRHAGRGHTRIGRPGQVEAPAWFGQFARGPGRCHWDTDIDSALWEKLAVNAVINPLTAVHRCRNGALAEHAQLREAVAALCREVTQVSYAAGYTDTAQTIEDKVQQVIRATAANRSSMLQDVAHGRATEIDHITGYLLRVAREHGIPARHHQALFDEVTALAP